MNAASDRPDGSPASDDYGLGDAGFDALLAKIERERGFACGAYKAKCLRRRIAGRARARGLASFEEYAALLDRDGVEYERLVDALTINVTKFFRNHTVFDGIARHVLPAMASLPSDDLRIWSAGCASGEEPYSLAILAREHEAAAPSHARTLASRLRIVGSDIDAASLRAAGTGVFPKASFAEMPAELRPRHFVGPSYSEIAPPLRSLVSFERRDLLADGAPFADAHLITCRNVLIYFDRASQETLLERFHAALAPGGFLVLGKVEMLLGRARSLFANVEARERIYRKR